MAIANDSVTVTPGTGATMATHTPTGSTKEYQAFIACDENGHLEETIPTYTWWLPSQTSAASKSYGDIFNGVGSGKFIEVRGIWCIPKSDVAVTGVTAIGINLMRTSTVGTGGTAHTYNGGTTEASHVITPWDTNNAALPVQITARMAPSAGATTAAFYWAQYFFTEETNAATYIGAFTNMLPMLHKGQKMTLNEGQGLIIKENGTISPVGSLGFLTIFTIVP